MRLRKTNNFSHPFSFNSFKIRNAEQLATLRKLGKTAVLVTHDLAEAAAMSDRVVVLGRNPGRIRKEIAVPEAIRRLAPTEARKHPSFQALFDALWVELNAGEREGGSHE